MKHNCQRKGFFFFFIAKILFRNLPHLPSVRKGYCAIIIFVRFATKISQTKSEKTDDF